MKPALTERAFTITLTKYKIRETYRLSPKKKLEWLTEANEFVDKTLPPDKRKVWMKKTGRIR